MHHVVFGCCRTPNSFKSRQIGVEDANYEQFFNGDTPKHKWATNMGLQVELGKHSKYMYHELKSLMNEDQHPNLMSRPDYLVTGPRGTLSFLKVYGFITEYYPLGNLGHLIQRKKRENSLTLDLKLGWSTQNVSALEWFL
jgi:hypothetical protein